MTPLQRILATSLVAFLGQIAAAAVVTDPAGDFLATYTGAQGADLDLRQVEVRFDGITFGFEATLNAALGITPGAFVAFGVDRGKGTAGAFQASEPKIAEFALHDAVVLLRPNLTGTVVLVNAGMAPTFTPLAAGAVTVSGATISGLVPLSLLPTTGLAPSDYRFTAWTRSGAGSNALVADFAPDQSTFRASVPAPATAAMLALALAGTLALRRCRALDRA